MFCMPQAVRMYLHFSFSLSYDEEQAMSENTVRDLRSRSGQSLGSKSTKSGNVRPVTATWKWVHNLDYRVDFSSPWSRDGIWDHGSFKWEIWENLPAHFCMILRLQVKTKRDRRVPFVAWEILGFLTISTNLKKVRSKSNKMQENSLTLRHTHFHIKLDKLSWNHCFLVFCMKCHLVTFLSHLFIGNAKKDILIF